MGKYKGYTEARERANKKYRDTIETVLIRLPKGKKAEIHDAAIRDGKSINRFIVDAIDKAIQQDE